MKFIKTIFSNKSSRVWFSVTVALLVFFLIVSIVASTFAYEPISMILGSSRAVYADGIESIYLTDYKNKDEVYKAAQEINLNLAREGMVLLKNKDNALPIYTPESPAGKKTSVKPKVSVFGKNSWDIAYGGSGSGGFSKGKNIVSLYDGLERAGYELNPELKNFYGSSQSGEGRTSAPKLTYGSEGVSGLTLNTGETPQSSYTSSVKNSYSNYKDAAFVVFTRIGGENFDLPRTMSGAVGANNDSDHFLQLDKNELDLLSTVISSGFGKIVVIINSGSAMQLDYLNDPAYSDKINAVVWMGFSGENGTSALGEIMNGTTNPSGRTPDTYATDFKKDPTWNNFGEHRYQLDGNKLQPYYFVHYEESVFTGYKYYETRGHTDGENWYKENVIYPFGYGLSYTDFTWEIADDSPIKNKTITNGQKYTIKIKVTNKGSVAGKDVVQLYGSAPYFDGKIEKPYVTLLNYAKTDLIAPGGNDIVELVFDPYYLASYDYKDKNGNGFTGFELDSGNYSLFINRNSHNTMFTIPFASPSIRYAKDPVTGKDVVNRYTGNQNEYMNSDLQLSVLLSQSDWNATWPTAPTNTDRTVSQAFINAVADTNHNNPTDFSKIKMPLTEELNRLTLRDMLFDSDGKPYQTKNGIPYIDYDDSLWEDLLDQMVVSEAISLYNFAAYQTRELPSIGIPKTTSGDGPVGWRNYMSTTTVYDTCAYVAQVVIAATFNQELAEEFGKMVGEEGIIGNYRGDKMPYTGWYAPGVNIHRSPFGGRNFEYYSEDGILSGKMAAAVIRGAQSKGVSCYIKHFAFNEQETFRTSSLSWVDEQAMREIYLRPYEIAVKEGGTRALMTSFNRIGTRWTGGDYRLVTSILRDEWGFRGAVICDFNSGTPYMVPRQMAYAGGDLNLANTPNNWCNASSAADVYIMRQCIKNVAYAIGNSNAMNGEIIGLKMPFWQIGLIIFDCVLVLCLVVWGYFSIRKAIKRA